MKTIDVNRYKNNWCKRCRHVLKFDYSECCHNERRDRYIDSHVVKACVNGNWFVSDDPAQDYDELGGMEQSVRLEAARRD